MAFVEVAEVESWLDRLYIAAEGAKLRDEDHRKAIEVAAMLDEIGRAVARFSRRSQLTLVDAAAGKSYLGLLSAKLVFEPSGRNARIISIERNPSRLKAAKLAIERLQTTIPIECRVADVAEGKAWPDSPAIVAALHACGPAADLIIDQSLERRAGMLLLVPCCTSRAARASAFAETEALLRGIPPQAPVRRRYIQALVDAERTWRLESAGYETEVVEFVGATITPHNLLWRSRRVQQPARMERARKKLMLFSRRAGDGPSN